MKNTLKFLLIFFALMLIAFLVGGNYFQKGVLENITSPATIERLKSLEKNSLQQEEEEKEFISPENDLTFKYSSSWQEISDEETLQKLSLEDEENNYHFEVIFFAQKFQPNQTLIVNKSLLEFEDLEEVISIMTDLNSKEGNMEIIKQEKKESEITIEAEYEDKNNNVFHSIEKVLFKEKGDMKEVFIVAIVTPEESWDGPTKEASEIIESVKLINDNQI